MSFSVGCLLQPSINLFYTRNHHTQTSTNSATYTFFELDNIGHFCASRKVPIPTTSLLNFSGRCDEYLGLIFGIGSRAKPFFTALAFGCGYNYSLDKTRFCVGIGNDYHQIELHHARDSLRTLVLAQLVFLHAQDHYEAMRAELPDDDCRELADGFLDWAKRRGMFVSSSTFPSEKEKKHDNKNDFGNETSHVLLFHSTSRCACRRRCVPSMGFSSNFRFPRTKWFGNSGSARPAIDPTGSATLECNASAFETNGAR